MHNSNVLSLKSTKVLAFTALFVGLSVILPLIFHFIPNIEAGKIFLPMEIFIFAAGLGLGWKSGLIAGILTPLISYSLSGMPKIEILPFMIVELAVYGIISGLLYRKLRLNIWLSLPGSMLLGRAAIWLAMFFFSANINAGQYVVSAFRAGIPGIILELALVPLAVKFVSNYLKDERI